MFTCNICEFSTGKQLSYTRHLETNKHKLNLKLDVKRDKIIKRFVCNYCETVFQNDKLLTKHNKLCLQNPNNKLCKFCNVIFNKETNYINHIEICSNNKLTELETNLKNKNTDVERLRNLNEKINEEIRKYCFDSSNRTNNNSVNVQFNLYFNNVPPIKEIEDFSLYNKEDLDDEEY